jgi:ferric-dicitrate binding protein FerR (iron transport regulator)
VAAAVIVLLVVGVWLGTMHRRQAAPVAATTDYLKNDVPPGGNKALLTLANGKTVVLDSLNNGTVALQGNTKVLKLNNGQLAYNRINQGPVEEVYNTLRTPVGGQYKIILPDGSKVWLNAASSIRFPTAFTGNERQVFIQGEAYFEVARNETKPFIVSVNDIEVKVIGTHFNIMAYGDEPAVETTLLEGAVEVTRGDAATMLRPGQQASIVHGGKISLMKDIDVHEATAWKDGLFQFNEAGVADIMRQIARWYNVEIIYADGIPPGHITGKIPRNTNLSKVLEMMQLSGIHCKIEGREVIVLPT